MQWVLGSGIRIYFLLIRLTYIFAKGNDNPYFKPKNGGFQLEFVSISRVLNHMTSYNSSALIGWNYSIQTGEQIL